MTNSNSDVVPSSGDAVARAIKALRGFAGITAHELAERTGISHSMVKLLETGRRDVTPMHAALIQSSCGADARRLIQGELFEWDGETPYSVESFNRWLGRGVFSQPKVWLKYLKALHREQELAVEKMAPDELRMYVSFQAASLAGESSPGSFSEMLSGIEYWKPIDGSSTAIKKK